ncbi:uncharacterized protein LOC131633488 [Vicia villosa]|uniref:uncharacterized protein LOC131607954 n=1 Tax=Vicia villosa TaxID=3911 RepID=UPI00273CC8BE|nr:uncharacterized protein LOC131607954 [Vicia villosa]XP_058760184.1 uncharacterized protein LOC131633488 [Vicia villosa]
MSDWGPVFVSIVLFVLLTPGLLFQIPGRSRCIEFGNFQTSGASILIHSLLYFGLVCIFFLAVKIHLCKLCKVMAADWAPVVISVVLFVLLSPGLLFQLPAKGRVVAFGSMQTSGISILVHTIIFFGLITIFLLAIGVHIYSG